MSTYNICFHGEIRKISVLFGFSVLIRSFDYNSRDIFEKCRCNDVETSLECHCNECSLYSIAMKTEYLLISFV